MKNKNNVVYVVTHKPIKQKIMEHGYEYISVGRECEGIKESDLIGDSISEKNATFCELTALYWIWKNTKLNNVGLCHYRRFFVTKRGSEYHVASLSELDNLLEKSDIVLPKRFKLPTRYWKYFEMNHGTNALEKCYDLLMEIDPTYIPIIESMKNRTELHCFNMFYAKKEIMDSYCEWLFKLLFEFEKKIDISTWTVQQKRVFGYLSEGLINLWIEHEGLIISECDVAQSELFPCDAECLVASCKFDNSLAFIKNKMLAVLWPILRKKRVINC